MIEEQVTQILEPMEKILNTPGLDALQKLRCILEEEFRVSMENYDPDHHVHNIKNVDMRQKILAGMVHRFAPVMGALTEQGIKEGLFQTNYPREASEIIVAGVHFVTDLGIFTWTKEEYVRRVKASEEIMEKTLGTSRGSFSFLSDLLESTPDRIKRDL